MPAPDADILERLKANYMNALKLVPPQLSEEFQRRIVRPDDLKDYARSISVAREFSNTTAMMAIQNQIADNFKRGGFGRKLTDLKVNPSQVYEQLLKGIFDY